MPLYEYRCNTCAERYELKRPASRSDDAATCPNGHTGATRVLSVFATSRVAGPSMNSAGGCGPGCACAAAN